MTQCMSLQGPDQGFKITLSSGAWDFSPTGGEWGILLGEFNLYGGGNLRKSEFNY